MCDNRAGGPSQRRQHLADRWRQVERHDSQRANRLLRADERCEAAGVILALGDRDPHFERPLPAPHLDHDLLPDAARIDVDAELPAVLHRLAVEGEDDIARFQSCLGRGASRHHIRDHHTGVDGEAERFGHQRRDRLGVDADFAAPDTAELPDLREDVPHDVAGSRKTYSLAASRLRVDQGVDTHQPAFSVHQRPAAVAGIDCGVGLNVNHRVLGCELTRHRAHHTHGDRGGQAERTAEGEYQLTGPQAVGIAELERREPACLHLDHADIRFAIDGHDLCADGAAAALEDRTAGRAARGIES